MRSRLLPARVLAAVLVLAPFSALAQEPAAQPATQEEPDVYQQAAQLAAEGRWAEAAEKYRAAIAIRDSAAARFNLGQAERNLGRLASAQREFARASELAATEQSEDVARLASQALAALAGRVPRIVIGVPADARGLEARIDGAVVPTGRAIELDPGRHDLVVTARQREPFVRAISLRQGERLRIDVSFAKPRAAAAPPPRKRSARSSTPPGRGVPIGPVLLAGAGAAAFTTATLLHIRRNDKLEEAGAGCERTGDGFVCPASEKNDAQHRDLIDAADRAELARDVMIGVGVGAWSAAALWWLFDTGRPERPVSATLGAGSHGAGARLRVGF